MSRNLREGEAGSMMGDQADDEIHNILFSNAFFRNWDRSALLSLHKGGLWSNYDAGQSLFSQGDECNLWSIVIAGKVLLSLASEDGRELVVAEVGPGDTFGDVELILDREYITDGFALMPTRLFSIRRSTFLRALERQSFSFPLLRAVCARWCNLAHLTEAMSLRSLEQRLASLLLNLCRTHGRPVRGGLLIDHPMSQTQMARLINASRPKVNVHLHVWKDRAWIRLDRSRIIVRDVQALEGLVDDASHV